MEPNLMTISLMLQMEKLKEKGKNGILPFSQADSNNFEDHVFYDENNPTYKNGLTLYNIVHNAALINHHDIISTLDDEYDGIDIKVAIDNDKEFPTTYILVSGNYHNTGLGREIEFVIEDGFLYEA